VSPNKVSHHLNTQDLTDRIIYHQFGALSVDNISNNTDTDTDTDVGHAEDNHTYSTPVGKSKKVTVDKLWLLNPISHGFQSKKKRKRGPGSGSSSLPSGQPPVS